MEEKLSILESLGAVKGFIFKNYGHGSRITNKTQNTFLKDGSKSKNDVVGLSDKSNLNIPEKIPEEEVLDEKMEGESVLSNKINSLNNNNVINKKTEKCDSFDCTSLLISSEPSPIDKKIFEGPDENESNEEEDKDDVSSDIQEWINHLPAKTERNSSSNTDSNCKNETPPADDTIPACAKLSREASIQSNSSLDSLLDARRRDPVEIFLNLGFGGVPGVNMENCRIPRRFLVPSKCKGGDWNEFLKRELIQAQNFECSSLGFRGLSGPSYRRPSAIVANIMEKLRESSVGTPSPRTRFSSVARRILNEKSVLNKLTSESASVLSPDSREFLQNQGKISPEVPRRRIIFGQKSFAFAHDGEFVEVESAAEAAKNAEASKSDEEETGLTKPDLLLKLRRSSLQKQKKVEEDADSDDVFYIVGKVDPFKEADPSFANRNCAQKAGKIPKRFFSSSNLKALELENEKSSDAIRLEVEKEIRALSQKVKNINSQDLASILEQIKQLRSKIDNTDQGAPEL